MINRMYPHLNLDKFNELLGALTKKERKVVNQYLEEIIYPILTQEDALLRAKKFLKK